MHRFGLITAALFLSAPAMALAGDKIYPWKASVDDATYEAEQTECGDAGKDAMNGVPSRYFQPAPGTGTAGAMGAGFAAGMARGLERGKALKDTYYGCMAAKGYSQRRFPSGEWQTFKKLPKDAQKRRFAELRSAPEPLHPEMPRDEYD